MSQIGSADRPRGSDSEAEVRSPWLDKFMSAILTYFGLIVTQRRATTKGSYRKGIFRRSSLNRLGKRALMVQAATYRELGRDAKAARRRKKIRQERAIPA